MSARNSFAEPTNIRCRILWWFAPRWCFWLTKASPTIKLPNASAPDERSSACGESDSLTDAWPVWKTASARDAPGLFPPELVVYVKAIACEFPSITGVPFSRWSVSELGSYVRNTGLTATLSDTTIWRWLHEDAIRPWQHRCWIFPRDPDFEQKASGSWISTKASGRAVSSGPMSSFSVQTKRRAFRRASESISP